MVAARTAWAGLEEGLRMASSLLARGVPFERLEASIDHSPLGQEARALVWLYVWCEGQPHALRELVELGEREVDDAVAPSE
jgi:hypothetical protein